MDVLSVDDEIGDRVCKSFSVIDVVVVDADVAGGNAGGYGAGGGGSGETVEGVTPTVGRDEGVASRTNTGGGNGRGDEGCRIQSDDMEQEDTKSILDNETDDPRGVLRVNIQATEAKMLRVSISSFYDMLTVFLKCQQEFGGY